MNKSDYIYKSKAIDVIFFFLLGLIVVYRWRIGLGGEKVVEFFFQGMQFMVLPIIVCYLFYRVNRYYQNIFCQIRYKDINEWRKKYLLDCILASVFLISIYYLILFVCCFTMTISYISYVLNLYVQTLLLFILFSQINHQCGVINKTSLSYCLCIVLGVGYVRLLSIMPPYFNFYEVDNEGYLTMFLLITAVILLLNIFVMVLKWKWEYIRGLSKDVFIIVIAIALFMLQNQFYANFYMIESLGFPDVFFISVTEIMLPLLVWAMSIVVLVTATLQVMLKNYRSHLLFYAIRMQNRSKWLVKTFMKGSLILIVLLIVKYGVNELFHTNNISFVWFLLEGFFRIQILALFMFLIYQVYKNTKLFSYGLIMMIIITFFAITTGSGADIILMRTHDIGTICILGILMFALLAGNCYAVNHLDYY